ncbi:MAG TPA: hypothetical protein VFR97_06620, partial [Capillimicrobium sp.]|nr:hypothetical protein [Capillimicrobium sp.]
MRRVLRLLVVALVAATGLALCPGSAAGASCANQTTTALPGAWISISLSCPMTGPAAIVTPPQHGTLTIGASDANGVWLTYRSDSAYRGVDTFSFSGSQEGTVTHTVKLEAPPLQCSGVWQPYGSPPPIPARDGSEVPIGVTCANLVYGDQLELELTPPAHGTVRDTSLGTDLGFRYRSTPGYV